MVETLLKAKVNYNCSYLAAPTLMHYAARSNDLELMNLLIKYGADKDIKDETSSTPMHYAAGFGRTSAVEELLKLGAQPDAKDHFGATPIDIATENGHFDIADLIKTRKKATLPNPHYHQYKDKKQLMEAFSKEEASINAKSPTISAKLDEVLENIKTSSLDKNSAILVEVSTWFSQTIDLLETLIDHEFLEKDDKDKIKALIKKQKTDREKLVIFGGLSTIAAEHENLHKWITSLIPENDKEKLWKECENAVCGNRINIIKYLVKYKAIPINRVNTEDGDTLLHASTYDDKAYNICIYLLKKGADPFIKNLANETPLDTAKQTKSSLIVEILEKHISKLDHK